jgi:dCMP deaminase
MHKDRYFLSMAFLVSKRSTCSRRSTGCVTISNTGKVLSTGYNGVPSGVVHCIEKPCGGESYESGCGLSKCKATHAEANALLQCNNCEDIHTIYCTTEPCIECTKLILNTGCQRIVFGQEYPHSEASLALWVESGKSKEDWVQLEYFNENDTI